jgi:hypothetical protein
MSFTAKVKETRELFIATTDLGTKRDTYRDAHLPLDPKVFYAGHLFLDSPAGRSHYVNFQEATSAVFHGSELVGGSWGNKTCSVYTRRTMKVSGVVSFEGLTADGVRVLREFESKKLSGLGFTFGSAPDRAVVRWDSIVRLAVVSRIAAIVTSRQDDPQEVILSLPDFN